MLYARSEGTEVGSYVYYEKPGVVALVGQGLFRLFRYPNSAATSIHWRLGVYESTKGTCKSRLSRTKSSARQRTLDQYQVQLKWNSRTLSRTKYDLGVQT